MDVIWMFSLCWFSRSSCCHYRPVNTRWRSWVVACSTLIAPAKSLPGPRLFTLICLSFRAENTSRFFPHRGGACRHTDMQQSGGWDVTWTEWSRDSQTASPSAMLLRLHARDWSRITRTDRPAVQRRNQSSVPPSELQVRRLSTSALWNARTAFCKTSGKFLSKFRVLWRRKQALWFIIVVSKISRRWYFFFCIWYVGF